MAISSMRCGFSLISLRFQPHQLAVLLFHRLYADAWPVSFNFVFVHILKIKVCAEGGNRTHGREHSNNNEK